MTSAPYLAIKSFRRFQHYKERNPIWIKLYTGLMIDGPFLGMPEQAQAQLIKLWLLAAQLGHPLPNHPKFLKGKIGTTGKFYISQLISAGFIVECDDLEASARVAEERITTDEDDADAALPSPDSSGKPPNPASKSASTNASKSASANSPNSASANSRALARESREQRLEGRDLSTDLPTKQAESKKGESAATREHASREKPDAIAGRIATDPHEAACLLAAAANRGIAERWGEQTRPILANAGDSTTATQEITTIAPISFAVDAVYTWCVRNGKTRDGKPPRGLGYFVPIVNEAWGIHLAQSGAVRSGAKLLPDQSPATSSARPEWQLSDHERLDLAAARLDAEEAAANAARAARAAGVARG